MNKFYKGVSTLMILSMISAPINCFALTKTETVFSNLKSNGEVKSTDISVGLTNLDKGDIVDYSKLDNIKNVNGEEKFSRESEKITWKSTGKDIYYKGVLNDNLPITVSCKYYLNGEEKSLSEMKDKSGTVKMVFTFKNHLYDYNSHMYTPFVVSTLYTIDSKDNSNVEVSSGKVINTGNKTIITGISAPGLYESTDIEELKDMDTVTITYDTSKFSMNEVYFVMSPKLLEEVDLDFSKVSNLTSSLNTLQDGVNSLQSGANTIVEGEDTFNTGLSTLNSGLKEAMEGSNNLYEGLVQVNSGVSSLSNLTTLVDTLYSNYVKNSELLNNINSGVTKEQLENGIADATSKKTELENKLNEVNAGITMLESLESLTDEQSVQLETLKGQKTQLEYGISEYAKGISEAQTNLQSLPLAAAKLSGANEAIIQVLCGVLGVSDPSMINEDTINVFKTNINNLVGGVNQLTEGSKKLSTGLGELYEGSNKLVEGSTKLGDGNKSLLEGITKLNNEGISKLNSYGKKINNYSDKVNTLVNLSKNYKGYTSNNSDKTIFIYKLSK